MGCEDPRRGLTRLIVPPFSPYLCTSWDPSPTRAARAKPSHRRKPNHNPTTEKNPSNQTAFPSEVLTNGATELLTRNLGGLRPTSEVKLFVTSLKGSLLHLEMGVQESTVWTRRGPLLFPLPVPVPSLVELSAGSSIEIPESMSSVWA